MRRVQGQTFDTMDLDNPGRGAEVGKRHELRTGDASSSALRPIATYDMLASFRCGLNRAASLKPNPALQRPLAESQRIPQRC